MAASRQTMLRALKQLRLPVRGGTPPAHHLSAQRTFTSGSTHGGGSQADLENALLLKNNIESAREADVRSSADLLTQHADQAVEAMRQVVEKQEAVGREFCTLSYKYFGSAVVLGCINRKLEYYWKDKGLSGSGVSSCS